MNENYKIYVHIFPNGKLYIGQTRQSLKNRFGKNGYNYKGCKRMSDAICEFGWDNIIHLLLFDNLTSEIADIIEIELIKKYKTYDINYGYNMTLGGKDGIYKKKCYQYDIEGNFINEYENTSIAVEKYGYGIYSCLTNKTLSAYGYQWSYTKSKKIDKYNRLNNGTPLRVRKIYKYDFSGKFLASYNSIVEAEKFTNIPAYRITSCANGQSKSAGGFLWSYLKEEALTPYKIYSGKNTSKDFSHKGKPVYQYDLDGRFIKKFNTIKEATDEIGKTKCSGISACCKNKQKSAYGYIWSYYFKNNIDSYNVKTKEKKVAQISKDNNNILNIFDSIQSAERITNVAHSNILKCCKGERNSAGGYIWKYA